MPDLKVEKSPSGRFYIFNDNRRNIVHKNPYLFNRLGLGELASPVVVFSPDDGEAMVKIKWGEQATLTHKVTSLRTLDELEEYPINWDSRDFNPYEAWESMYYYDRKTSRLIPVIRHIPLEGRYYLSVGDKKIYLARKQKP